MKKISYDKGQDKGELSKQELQEEELWQDMQESCEYCQTHYYDLNSETMDRCQKPLA